MSKKTTSKRHWPTRTKKSALKKVLGQPSWEIGHDKVQAFVTQTGGHLGPVAFALKNNQQVQPYSVAPWCDEKVDANMPAILKVLRGDFFCLPFGGNSSLHGDEKHPVHGETANNVWQFEQRYEDDAMNILHLSMETGVREGRVDKLVAVLAGESAVYTSHTVSGMKGVMCPGYHAMLRFPDEPGSGLISVAPFVWGQVFPGNFENAAEGGYSSLKAGAKFDRLDKVPMDNGGIADLSRYPARSGYEDLVMLVTKPNQTLGWTAVTFPQEGYLWLTLKNPKSLRNTVLWHSNGGRHMAPWSGRHRCVMGLEETTSYFHHGLAESAKPNPVSKAGYPTVVKLDPHEPAIFSTIGLATAVPSTFGHVQRVEARDDGKGVDVIDRKGKKIRVQVDVDFLAEG